jgi:hypothetical protein
MATQTGKIRIMEVIQAVITISRVTAIREIRKPIRNMRTKMIIRPIVMMRGKAIIKAPKSVLQKKISSSKNRTMVSSAVRTRVPPFLHLMRAQAALGREGDTTTLIALIRETTIIAKESIIRTMHLSWLILNKTVIRVAVITLIKIRPLMIRNSRDAVLRLPRKKTMFRL